MLTAGDGGPRCLSPTLRWFHKTSNKFLEYKYNPYGADLTHHARALVCAARAPGMRLCDIATRLGITEHSATGITTASYASNDADGRHNRYRIQRRQLKSKGLVLAGNVAAAGPGARTT